MDLCRRQASHAVASVFQRFEEPAPDVTACPERPPGLRDRVAILTLLDTGDGADGFPLLMW